MDSERFEIGIWDALFSFFFSHHGLFILILQYACFKFQAMGGSKKIVMPIDAKKLAKFSMIKI